MSGLQIPLGQKNVSRFIRHLATAAMLSGGGRRWVRQRGRDWSPALTSELKQMEVPIHGCLSELVQLIRFFSISVLSEIGAIDYDVSLFKHRIDYNN